MKDEEIAEEWVRTKHNILKDCLSACVRAEHKNEIQAFLAGLKAGRPQWHDLRENPNDLPRKNKSYWVYMDCQGNKIYRSIVWQGCWCGWNGIPLAWCEEPTFDDKE